MNTDKFEQDYVFIDVLGMTCAWLMRINFPHGSVWWDIFVIATHKKHLILGCSLP